MQQTTMVAVVAAAAATQVFQISLSRQAALLRIGLAVRQATHFLTERPDPHRRAMWAICPSARRVVTMVPPTIMVQAGPPASA